MKSMWVTAFFLKCHVGYVTLEKIWNAVSMATLGISLSF